MPSGMYPVGKLGRGGNDPTINALAPPHTSCLLRIYDPITSTAYLIDTGADISIIPAKRGHSPPLPSLRNLFAANGSAIPIYGEQILVLSLNLRRTFSHSFIVGDVTQPIIGSDFLDKFDILVDIK